MKISTGRRRIIKAVDNFLDAYKEDLVKQYQKGYHDGQNDAISEIPEIGGKIKELILVRDDTNEEVKIVPCSECLFLIEPYNVVRYENKIVSWPAGGRIKPLKYDEDISYIKYLGGAKK